MCVNQETRQHLLIDPPFTAFQESQHLLTSLSRFHQGQWFPHQPPPYPLAGFFCLGKTKEKDKKEKSGKKILLFKKNSWHTTKKAEPIGSAF